MQRNINFGPLPSVQTVIFFAVFCTWDSYSNSLYCIVFSTYESHESADTIGTQDSVTTIIYTGFGPSYSYVDGRDACRDVWKGHIM